MKKLDKFLLLDYNFVHNILNQSLEVKQFWKNLDLKSGLRHGRGYEEFENHFNINILAQIKENKLQKRKVETEQKFSKNRICKFCNKEFSWNETQYPYSEFCSKSCSAKYSSSHVNPKNISKNMNKMHIIQCMNCGKDIERKINVYKTLCDTCRKEFYNVKKICAVCGNEFIAKQKDVQTCSNECAKRIRVESFKKTQSIKHSCGGLRRGSGRGKHGWYKGYYCDSSWELAWVIYSLDHNIKFVRNTQGFEYIFDRKIHKYYPDFLLSDNTYIEIKGYQTEQWKAKYQQVQIPLIVLSRTEMQPIFNYVQTKYGSNWIELYDNSKPIKDLSKQQYIWVHNSERNKVIKVEKLQEFLDNKWIIGRKKFNKNSTSNNFI